MIFKETELNGAYIIEIDKREDERGFFARCWCKNEFKSKGLMANIAQSSISFNKEKGTLRGMHFQLKPFDEEKLLRCSAGSIYDVIIDLRTDSTSYKKWTSVELSAKNQRMLYIPKGFAHGFQTLEHGAEVVYHISEFYNPESASGVRWNDPQFNISWPLMVSKISTKDQNYLDYKG